VTARRKLIEVALPLDAINAACKADKDRKTGTIRNLHKWFAPMPPPAWRALLFATLVDDPEDERERDRLLRLIERLVESGGDLPTSSVLNEARLEIQRCWPEGPPTIMDPFCGGGSTLIEGQRLGCETVGADLNPVPVLITKVLTELVPALAGERALHEPQEALPVATTPHEGVVADVVHYAAAVKEDAWSRLADYYPLYDDGLPITAWLWCRTVACPNPACAATAPLIDNTMLSRKPGAERQVVVSFRDHTPGFEVVDGQGNGPRSSVERSGAICLKCQTSIPFTRIRSEGHAGRLGLRLMAMVLDRDEGRLFVSPSRSQEELALAVPELDPPLDLPLVQNPADVKPGLYGAKTHADLYSSRQRLLLGAFAEAVSVVPERVDKDGGSPERGRAVAAILALCVGKLAQYASMQALIGPTTSGTWFQSGFTRQVIQMTWDFCEVNPFAGSGPSWEQMVTTALRAIPFAPTGRGRALQLDARMASAATNGPTLFATDPPYFNQISYADLSDYFYVWLRRCLVRTLPELFKTMATPKNAELVASPIRHGSQDEARRYFVDGFVETFGGLISAQTAETPALVVYAFKEQNNSVTGDDIAPGWEAILEAMMAAGLVIVGTWPIHGTGSTRMVSMGTNALATYVVLAVRPRPAGAARITKSDLARLLRAELGASVAELQQANIAPVDLAQAVIGPGMEIYSRHSGVVETDGSRVGVAQALGLINRTLAEVLDEQEGDLDPDSRWAATWYEQHGFSTATFGEADRLARPKGIAVDSLVQAGIVTSGANKVALISRGDLPSAWDPRLDSRPTAWEAVHYLIRTLLDEGGEPEAAQLYARLGVLADPARELAYRLFQIADRNGQKEEAMAYNALVTSWSEIARLAESLPSESTRHAAAEALF
jgi:putative DNA methylase